MEEIRQQFLAMWHGPGHLRFLMQPCLAVLFGILDGKKDARAGRAPFGLVLAGRAEGDRREGLGGALKRMALPLALAVTLSALFQWINLRRLHPLGTLCFAIFLVALPYAAARGVANRVSRARPSHPVGGEV